MCLGKNLRSTILRWGNRSRILKAKKNSFENVIKEEWKIRASLYKKFRTKAWCCSDFAMKLLLATKEIEGKKKL